MAGARQSAEPRASKLDALTGLRFFAAFAIVIHHSRSHILPADFLQAWPLEQGVSFFFVLSGFILSYAYPELQDRRAVARFWLSRAARLWPCHIAALLFALAMSSFMLTGPWQLVANVLLIQSWIPFMDYFWSYNPVSWSISTEVGFYIFFPFLIANFRKTWWIKLAAAATVLVALIALAQNFPADADLRRATDFSSIGLIYISPLARIFEFILGMCTYLLWNRTRGLVASTALLWTVAEVLAIGFTLWTLRYAVWLIAWEVSPIFPIWPTQIGTCVAFASLVFVMASGQGIIGRALSWQPFVFLGEISFAMYLFHLPMINALSPFLSSSGLPPWLTAGAMLAVLLLLSTAVMLLIERPAKTRIVAIFRIGMDRRVAPAHSIAVHTLPIR